MSARYAVLAVLTWISVVACVPDRVAHRPADGPETPWNGSHHWIQNDLLRNVMDRLTEQSPGDLGDPGRAPDARMLEDAATYARALSQATMRIPDAVADEHMSEADRAAFDSEVATLREQADALEAAAHNQDVDTMRRIVSEIDATCTSCHTRFRDYSGLLENQRRAARPAPGTRRRSAQAGPIARGA